MIVNVTKVYACIHRKFSGKTIKFQQNCVLLQSIFRGGGHAHHAPYKCMPPFRNLTLAPCGPLETSHFAFWSTTYIVIVFHDFYHIELQVPPTVIGYSLESLLCVIALLQSMFGNSLNFTVLVLYRLWHNEIGDLSGSCYLVMVWSML